MEDVLPTGNVMDVEVDVVPVPVNPLAAVTALCGPRLPGLVVALAWLVGVHVWAKVSGVVIIKQAIATEKVKILFITMKFKGF